MCRIRIEGKYVIFYVGYNSDINLASYPIRGEGTSPINYLELVIGYGDFLAHSVSFTTLWKAFMAFSIALR